MISRPNVRARCFQKDLRTRTPRNRYYLPRDHKLYIASKYRCTWCRRQHSTWDFWLWPGLCRGCCTWLHEHGGADMYFAKHANYWGANDDQD